MLQQEQDCQLHIIAYASCALSHAERRYCITCKELIDEVPATSARTTRAALTYLMKMPEAIGQ